LPVLDYAAVANLFGPMNPDGRKLAADESELGVENLSLELNLGKRRPIVCISF
jgi:hypothetical protein